MCFTLSKVAPHDRWNRDGDHITHECTVPASRPVPGSPPNKSSHDIDVRAFLVTERNEVMRKTPRPVVGPKPCVPGSTTVTPTYGAGTTIDFTSGKFSVNRHVFGQSPSDAARYRGGRGLPHNNEIAVDDEFSRKNRSHVLYGGSVAYDRQFKWRIKAAAEHIRETYFSRLG